MLAKRLRQTQEVTIVLPLFMPAKDWACQFLQNINRLEAFLPCISFRYILVHDGPECSEIRKGVARLQSASDTIRFYCYAQNRGKGYALRYGVKQAQSPFVLIMDVDFPYEFENIRDVIAALQAGYEVVAGRRTSPYFSRLPLKRKLISRSYTLCNRLLFDLPVHDTQSGLKGFNCKGKMVFLQTKINRFLVDTEFLLRASKQCLNIKVIDVHLRPHVTFSNFGLNVLHTELQNLISLVWLQQRLKNEIMEQNPHFSFYALPQEH